MKRLITLFAAVMCTVWAGAMSYGEAREEALYLTDKMAYELHLTEQQYNDAYEINLDYLMGVRTVDDVYGSYWRYRNDDLRCILYDWQWDMYRAADYFLRPLTWYAGAWYLPVRRHYAAGCYYYSRPRVYVSYAGGHCRRHYAGGYYVNRRPVAVHRGHCRGDVVVRNGGGSHGGVVIGSGRRGDGGFARGGRGDIYGSGRSGRGGGSDAVLGRGGMHGDHSYGRR